MVDAAAVAQTKTVAPNKNDEMSVRLVPSAATKVAPSETEIKNYWVFQFESDDPTAKLAAKAYAPYQRYKVVEGSGQRLVVVANTFDENFANDMTVGSSTYTDLIAKNYRLASSPASDTDAPDLWRKDATGARGMMFVCDTIISSMVEGMDLNLILRRIVAKVTLKVKLAAATEGMTDWTIQFCGLNRNVYYNPHGNLPEGYIQDPSKVVNAFPVNADTINYTPMVYTTFNSTDFTTVKDVYIPVNCRGQASEVLLSSNRRTYAPKMSAYAYIHGEVRNVTELSPSIPNSYPSTVVDYYIHLASDGVFLKDYNVLPNTHYTFEITLDRKSISTDSRLVYERIYNPASEDYVGLLGGEVIGAGTPDDPYRFERRLILEHNFTTTISAADLGGTNLRGLGTSETNGKLNSYNLMKDNVSGKFAVFQDIARRNGGIPASMDDINYVWFMPAMYQQAAISHVVYNLQSPGKATGGYYVSTFNYAGGSNATSDTYIMHGAEHGTSVISRWLGYSNRSTATLRYRPVRENPSAPIYGFQSPYKQ